MHGSIFATIGTTVFEKAIPYRQSVRNDLQDGKLLSPSEVTAMETKLRANPQDSVPFGLLLVECRLADE